MANPISRHNNWRSILSYRIKEPYARARARIIASPELLRTISLSPEKAWIDDIIIIESVSSNDVNFANAPAGYHGHIDFTVPSRNNGWWIIPLSHWQEFIEIL